MKKHTQSTINRFAKWKYIVLAISLIIMLLSALPSLYGENAALQINHRGHTVDAPQISQRLQQAGITPTSIDQQGDSTIVILSDPTQQAQAQSVLNQYLDSSITVALAMEAAAPKWLLSAGFSPIALGLDLRGGVQFLLEVDMEPVYQAHRQMVIDEFASEIRASRGRVIQDAVQINLYNDQDVTTARTLLRSQFANWDSRISGNTVTLSLSDDEKIALRTLTVQQNLQIMRGRLAELGITEASVQRQGESRIRIELPGVQDPAAAKDVIGATASLAFHSMPDTQSRQSLTLLDNDGHTVHVDRRAILAGEHIIDARAGLGEMGTSEVNISLDSSGGRKMSQFTRTNIGQPMATLYNEYSRDASGESQQVSKVISVATIQSQLGSRFRITGVGSMQDAQELALLLRAGSLTAPVTIIEERTIGPSLGAENVKNGFAALALGLALTLSFIALWYRKMGWVANVALLANMVCLFGLIALLPGAVLTLPGIAGMVLTVGMAVDTNVLIFERIKDKMREGRTFAQSIDKGFNSAFSSIFDANLTTMIVAIALYTIGNGPIQGFAITLGLGLLTSLFTGVFLSRAIINLIWGRDQRREVKV
ncbi:protein-export membrane protein SecD [Vibrio sp. 10N.286.49.C2]|uniref:protein translocase subunit SecD n=1 Tax=unclassified Vibrio TaxID=2614977 RepID=UPI000C8251B8|nr:MULTISPECIES: protein translocase subunit SecD [unclassified Vibrio]PMH33169.1 protein-export membrane protein SecD [Vibrio sp. 10N.286.49.C2]PMH51217.1 protein-export membrane protein SecD [Vibrio sp. 10N.286.49.B1]PMH81979.1 protein-export membrane protein SecD [Vibrio sp. 10N.286.48.B7]